MKSLGSVARGMIVWGTALLLAGCGWSYAPQMRGNPSSAGRNLSALREHQTASPSTFTQALAADYLQLATGLHEQKRDYADTDYFARKGLRTAEGEAVPPENNANWLIPLEVPDKFRTELATSRDRLVKALDGGARERQPRLAATAQVSYDCWVEQMEDDWKAAVSGACRKQFLDTLAQLEGAPPPRGARQFRVYFEFGRSELLPEARQILEQVVATAKRQRGVHIVLIGKTDLAGSDRSNLELSKRRADVVHNELVREGIAPARITTRYVGDREPPVPTGKGAREPRNRVVEIELR